MPESITVNGKVYFSEDLLINMMVSKAIEFSCLDLLLVEETESDRIEAYQALLKGLKKYMPDAEKSLRKLYVSTRFPETT